MVVLRWLVVMMMVLGVGLGKCVGMSWEWCGAAFCEALAGGLAGRLGRAARLVCWLYIGKTGAYIRRQTRLFT